MPILGILCTHRGRGGGRSYSHSIHKAKEIGPQSTKEVVIVVKGVGTQSTIRLHHNAL